jgi:hypothetical protein
MSGEVEFSEILKWAERLDFRRTIALYSHHGLPIEPIINYTIREPVSAAVIPQCLPPGSQR